MLVRTGAMTHRSNQEKTSRTLTAILLTVTSLAAGGASAAADTNADFSVNVYGPVKVHTCTTANQVGVFGRYGAWGNFIDGCTVGLSCPSTSTSCLAREQTSIHTESYIGHRVTQNARLRVFNGSGRVLWRRDQSCSGTDWCQNAGSIRLRPSQYASPPPSPLLQRARRGGPPAPADARSSSR
jgi:hypothetical protein